MIGVPDVRYREDPVRIIRVVRFAAKLGFEIEKKTRAPLRDMAPLLANVPPSRLFDEMFKLLQTGHARASLTELRKQGLERGIFPVLDAVFDPSRAQHPVREQFIDLALADTDRRVAEGKSVAPSFLLACMLWHDVLAQWQINKEAGESAFPALQQATDAVFNARIGDISGRGKLAADMREIWTMQPRFEKRIGSGPITLVEQPRFRAGFDFLRLRAQVEEVDLQLAQWWEDFSLADMPERRHLMEVAREQEESKRRSRPARVVAVKAPRAVALEPTATAVWVGEDEAAVDPAKKRRRRRRKTSAGAPPTDSPPQE
jgi:poly(A) polymerase